MVHVDLGHFEQRRAPTVRERHIQHTQSMLYITVIASVSIVVVAGLFLSLLH